MQHLHLSSPWLFQDNFKLTLSTFGELIWNIVDVIYTSMELQDIPSGTACKFWNFWTLEEFQNLTICLLIEVDFGTTRVNSRMTLGTLEPFQDAISRRRISSIVGTSVRSLSTQFGTLEHFQNELWDFSDSYQYAAAGGPPESFHNIISTKQRRVDAALELYLVLFKYLTSFISNISLNWLAIWMYFTPIDSSWTALSKVFWLQLNLTKRSSANSRKSQLSR